MTTYTLKQPPANGQFSDTVTNPSRSGDQVTGLATVPGGTATLTVTPTDTIDPACRGVVAPCDPVAAEGQSVARGTQANPP